VIKYIGSKRRLVPVLGELLSGSGARTAVDPFTGTTRVAQEFKRRGAVVTAADTARYSKVFARCYITTDADEVSAPELRRHLDRLNGLQPKAGYFTETFCVRSRFFRPENGARVDAIRDLLEAEYRDSPLFPILLTSLIEAADRVDSTTGVQMAYVKEWAPRALKPLELRVPALLSGPGRAVLGDALELAPQLGPFDLAYLDPPYNQHRYFTNYHVWETLVAWDFPDYYGVACKREDSRTRRTHSAFNRRREMPGALARVIRDVRAETIVLSYNDESWVTLEDLREQMSARGHCEVLAFDSKRYVGAQIGIHNPRGEKVGSVGRLRNTEYLLVAGEPARVERICAPFRNALTRTV